MNIINKLYIKLSLTLLISTLVCGILASWSFLHPEEYKYALPFQQLRPFHVSSALFWILTGATTCIYCFSSPLLHKKDQLYATIFQSIWMLGIVLVFISYIFKQYGGREYWEYPPYINFIFLTGWLFFIKYFSLFWKYIEDKKSVYVWMWLTGTIFFLFTFIEQNLWNISWFRSSFIKEMTIQWKSNGSMVGAWNQLIYGTGIYLMVKISGDKNIATSKWAYGSYSLGLSNLIFNWGHHIYNLPTAPWVRTISYSISMTEWIFVIGVIQNFKSKMIGNTKFYHLLSYRFILASEVWVFLNLVLALLISIPAINRYTHGTHITVAHAMGTTIGINTMILMGAFAYITNTESYTRYIRFTSKLIHKSLFVFWVALIIAGITKGYMLIERKAIFSEAFQATVPYIQLVFYAGIILTICISYIVIQYFRNVNYTNNKY